MNLVDELHAIAAAFTRAGVQYALCGGVAVTVHGATRSTKDIDVLVRPEDLALAVEAARPLGYVFSALPIVFEEGTDRERHVQRGSKIVGGEHLVLDLCWRRPPSPACSRIASRSRLPRGRWSWCRAPPSFR